MLVCQLGLPPLAMVSPESSDGKGMMRKGGSVFSGHRKGEKYNNYFSHMPINGEFSLGLMVWPLESGKQTA